MFSRQNCRTLSCCHRDKLSANEVTVCNFTHSYLLQLRIFTRRESSKLALVIVVSTIRNDCNSSTCSPILSSESEAKHYSKSFSMQTAVWTGESRANEGRFTSREEEDERGERSEVELRLREWSPFGWKLRLGKNLLQLED